MPTTACNGATLYYEEAGTGTPVVFLHGLMAGCRVFRGQLSGLDGCRALALDFRGHGRSTKTPAGHTMAQYARDVEAFLDGLGVDDAVLVGWSMGALVGWEYVDRFGTDRLAGFVDVDQPASDFQWDDYDYGSWDLADLARAVGRAQEDPDGLAESVAHSLFVDSPAADVARAIYDEASRVPPGVVSATYVDQTLRDYRDVLPDVDVPSLVYVCGEGALAPAGAVEDVAERLPDAEAVRFEESGHAPFLDATDRFNRRLTEFVASL
ncbi:alpha/beta fold hydrolase [Haloplanus sp. GCM10025708]|uniref:alpha/beta fold hydrolase n=1 Tax=Haloferacaceae TaxID=1644056 RepID=UPI00360C75AB